MHLAQNHISSLHMKIRFAFRPFEFRFWIIFSNMLAAAAAASPYAKYSKIFL